MSIEQKTADALLQSEMTVTINNKQYNVAPPSIATLVMASSKIAELPSVELNKDNILMETIAIAPECAIVSDIIAILILGAKKIKREGKCWWNPFKKSEFEALKNEIEESVTPRELQELLAGLLMRMDIGDFFGVTTSLIGVNLTKAKMMKTNQTQFGR